jgi:hypothetical protein
MEDKDQYIKDLESANQRLQEQLEDYEDKFIRKLDSLGVGRNIDMQTFSNLITIEQFIDYLGGSPYWKRVNAIGNWNGGTEYTFEFVGDSVDNDDSYGKRLTLLKPNSTSTPNHQINTAFRAFKDFWDLWIRMTGGNKNISLLLDILEYKYNDERGKAHGKKGN